MKPLLTYSGGKSKEIPLFEKYIPQTYDTYFEPFFGGGALFFHLTPKKAVINDINPQVITFYQELATNYNTVRSQLDELQAIFDDNKTEFKQLQKLHPNQKIHCKNETLWYALRDMLNHKKPSPFLDSVLYFYINKTLRNGLLRHNLNGDINSSYGYGRNFNSSTITQEYSELLSRTKIMSCDFSQVFNLATEKDFMFLDPPYDCIFTNYGKGNKKNGFDHTEQRRLAHEFSQLKCKALMIIGKTPLITELYHDYIKDEYDKTYAQKMLHDNNSHAKHLIITNY